MKNFLLIAILFVSSPAIMHAQDNKLPEKDGKVFYEVIDSTVTDISKSRLYNSSKLWVINYFKNPKVIQLDNADEGMIVGATNFPFFTGTGSHQCFFYFNITSKDGRYRIQIYDLMIAPYKGGVVPAETLNKYATQCWNRKYIDQINKGVTDLMLDLENSIHHSNETSNF